jgi:hypothetical protein
MKFARTLSAAIVMVASSWLSPVQAAVPPLGSREGELLCAGWTNVLASGAMLSTGGDPAAFIKAHGFFLGRLSLIAPDAKYSLNDFFAAYDRMNEMEKAELSDNCIAKLKQVGGFADRPQEPKAR